MGYYNSRPKTSVERIRDAVESIDSNLGQRILGETNASERTGYYNNRPKTNVERIREAVEDIDRQFVPADLYYKTITNVPVASVTDGADNVPVQNLKIGIEPVQDLHGYDSPWPAGGGKNLFNVGNTSGWESPSGGEITVSGNIVSLKVLSGGGTKYWRNFNLTLEGNVTISQKASVNNSRIYVRLRKADDSGWMTSDDATITGMAYNTYYGGWYTNAGNNTTFAKSITIPPCLYWQYGTRFDNASATTGNTETVSQIQIESGSTATPYAPYSNICPITGWTVAKVYRSGADTSNPDEYNISWETEAGTVYGGTLDVTTGVLTVTHGQIASYNGETLPGVWISDRDVYAPGTSPTTGAQVVYELATPQTYQLTPTQIATLLGINNVWADTGNVVKMTYPCTA